jgi:serine-type D-Ala-D-Ala endopeptidase (penicillin-binding protein 7)
MGQIQRKRCTKGKIAVSQQRVAAMSPQRTLHPLEGIVAGCALFFVLALTIGFAQAADPRSMARAQKVTATQGAFTQKVSLRSASVLVQDADTGEIVFTKNSEAIVPIASITKLMTAMVTIDRDLDMEQRVVVSREDVDSRKGTRSRLRTGSVLTREQLLLLALMASENRAAAALGRTYPEGKAAFVAAMNEKAAALGMSDSRFVDPTGLSSSNVSSARDLAKLVSAAHGYELIREYSTRNRATVSVYGRQTVFANTNGLVRNSHWEIGLSKTGYISEAGRCLVMRVRLASKDLIVVLLDSWGKQSRIGDANRIKKWLEASAARSS